MNANKIKKVFAAFLYLVFCGNPSAFSQQKQGHVMRPKPRGVGKTTVIGQAQLEVEYALNLSLIHI